MHSYSRKHGLADVYTNELISSFKENFNVALTWRDERWRATNNRFIENSEYFRIIANAVGLFAIPNKTKVIKDRVHKGTGLDKSKGQNNI